jgi:hypothetical protein
VERVRPSPSEEPGRPRESTPVAPRAPSHPAPGSASLLSLQRAAGNRAARLAVQRWGEEKRTQEQLAQDGVKGDTDAIVAIKDFATLTDVDRLTMVYYLTDQFWVGSKSEQALERIWTSFGPRFTEVAGANIRRWRSSVARHSDLPLKVPAAEKVYSNFSKDAGAVARRYLDQNLRFAASESQRLGVAPNSPAKPESDAEVNALQTAAAEVAKLQLAQKAARTCWVGWTEVLYPAMSDDQHYVEPVEYVPGHRPPLADLSSLRGRILLHDKEEGTWPELDRDRLPKLQERVKPYDEVQKADDAVGADLTGWLIRNPALAAVAAGGPEATAAFASAKGATEAKKLLGTSFERLRKNILDSQTKLDAGDLNPLDFTPIHEQLFAKKATADSGVDWSTPFAKDVAEDLTRDHNINRALRSMLLQQIAEFAFLLAPLTGGASMVALLAVGTTATGANLVLDAQRYEALAAAKAAGAQPGTDIVSGGVVDEARAAMESDAIAFALAALVMGASLASQLLQAMRAARLARLAELPEGFVTGRVKGLYDAVDPAASKVGEFTFTNEPVRTEGRWRVVRIEVKGADGSFGHVERAWDPATGEVQYREANLDMIPKERRWLNTDPPLQAGKGTPLSTYMNLRAMRALGVPAGGIRVLRLTGVQNVRSVIQFNLAIQAGLPEDAAAMKTQSTQYGGTAATQAGGGRIVGATVHGGQMVQLSDLLKTWEGEMPDPNMVANHNQLLGEYGLTRDTKWLVRSNFDIELRLADTPIVVPPVRPSDDKDKH